MCVAHLVKVFPALYHLLVNRETRALNLLTAQGFNQMFSLRVPKAIPTVIKFQYENIEEQHSFLLLRSISVRAFPVEQPNLTEWNGNALQVRPFIFLDYATTQILKSANHTSDSTARYDVCSALL